MVEKAFEFSEDAIHITDSEGALVLVNPAFLRLYRFDDPERILGSPVDRLWSFGSYRDYALLRGRIDTGMPWEGMMTARTGDGGEIPVRIAAHPLGAKPPSDGCIWFSRDRTRDILLEKELCEARRLAVFGSLAAGMARELNDSLASLLLDAGCLRDQIAKGRRKDPMVADAAASMVRCTERMRRVVRHLDLFARRDGFDSRTTFKVAKWIEDTLLLMRRRLAAERIEMVVECPPGLTVTGNRVQLESVLYELLANAREAFPAAARNRKIRIRAAPGPKATVSVEIRDNAGGIPSEALEWIFEPFFSTKRGPGAGLGLAMSRRILAEHGGSLECASCNGEAAFEIRLPVPFPAGTGPGQDPGLKADADG